MLAVAPLWPALVLATILWELEYLRLGSVGRQGLGKPTPAGPIFVQIQGLRPRSKRCSFCPALWMTRQCTSTHAEATYVQHEFDMNSTFQHEPGMSAA